MAIWHFRSLLVASPTAQSATSYVSVDNLLGGKRVLPVAPRSALEWVSVIRRGIPSSAVDALTKFAHLSHIELAAALVRQAKLVVSFRVKVPDGRNPWTGFRKV